METDPKTKSSGGVESELLPTCFEGHPLKLGRRDERCGYAGYNCNVCQEHFNYASPSWKCEEDQMRGGGKCDFDICVDCMEQRGADYIAAWHVVRKLAVLINLENLQSADEENYARFKRMLEPFPPQLVDRIDYSGGGNLLQYAVKMNQKEYLQILLDYGLDPMAPLAFQESRLSPLVEPIARGHMEVWNMLKEHIEMTVEMKLEQLYQMIVLPECQRRGKPQTEFKELLASIPVESVKPLPVISMGDPPVTGTLLQTAVQHYNKEAVLLLLEHGVDPNETSEDEKRTPMKIAAYLGVWVFVEILHEATGDEVPDDVKIHQLFKAMCEDDKDTFSEILHSLPPELVSSTYVGGSGSILQNAVQDSRKDFIRLLLEHGVDPTAKVGIPDYPDYPWEKTSIEMAGNSTELLSLFAEFAEIPTDLKIKLMTTSIENDKEDSEDIIKKQLEMFSVEELATGRISCEWEPDWRYCEGTFVQYLASCARKFQQLQLLLNHGVDPQATSEEVPDTPLEIAAMNENTEAFELLAPHYEEETKKKIAQLLIWGLTDHDPSEEFKMLFQSVPLAEVNSYQIWEYNLLQVLAKKGRRDHVAFLLEQGVDPEAKESTERPCPMDLAWDMNEAGTIAELMKYTDAPSMRWQSSSLWAEVEKEQERGWRKEVDALLERQQTEVVTLRKQMESQQTQIENQQKQMESQQKQIENLLKLIPAKVSAAEVED